MNLLIYVQGNPHLNTKTLTLTYVVTTDHDVTKSFVNQVLHKNIHNVTPSHDPQKLYDLIAQHFYHNQQCILH